MLVAVIAFFLAFAAAIGLAAVYYVHMFQLESYLPVQFSKWLLERAKSKRILVFLPAIVAAVVTVLWRESAVAFVAGAVLLACNAWFFRPFKAKKPLVFTPRVWRMLTTFALICILMSVLFAVLGLCGLAPLLLPFAGFILLLANLINRPIEKAVCNHYIKEAKNIIKARKNTLTVIGITGSYGKTSTKFFLTKLLSQKYNVLMTPASYNTTMGVVRVIREMLKPSHEIFICEMGARDIGEIKEICDIVLPSYGIITSIGPQHLETFKCIENIVKTKFELGDAVGVNDHMVLNGDNRYIYDRRYSEKYTYYGMVNTKVGYFAENVATTSDGTAFTLRFPDGEVLDFTSRLIGKHNVLNILASVAMADKFGIERRDLVRAVKMLEPPAHRLQIVDGGDITIIDDSFNSNPSGSRSALEALSSFDGVRVLVTPGMVELGDSQSILNYELGVSAGDFCEYIYVVGSVNYDSIYKGVLSTGFDVTRRLIRVNSPEEAIAMVRALPTSLKKIVLLENDLPDNFK